MVNQRNDFLSSITVEELKKMWEPAAQGVIKTWAQVNPAWPNTPLKLFGAGSDSGTFDYFTEAIVGKAKSSRGDYTASEDDNVLVQGVSSDQYGLGYFGLAYYSENKGKLKLVPVKVNSAAEAIYPTTLTVESGQYQPLSRPEFIYVNVKSASNPYVKKFVKFYLDNAAKLAEEVGYVALPAAAYQLSFKRFANNTKGSVFENKSTVGANLLELLSAKK